MKVRKAQLDEIPQVRIWLMDTAKWLKHKNIPQWERFLNYDATEICLKDYEEGKLYVIEDIEGKVKGALSFGKAEEIDEKLWDSVNNAYYIHRIVVPKEFKGLKVGESMINWAKEIAINHGKEIRLNCVQENEVLFKYYVSCGFKYSGCKLGYHLFKI